MLKKFMVSPSNHCDSQGSGRRESITDFVRGLKYYIMISFTTELLCTPATITPLTKIKQSSHQGTNVIHQELALIHVHWYSRATNLKCLSRYKMAIYNHLNIAYANTQLDSSFNRISHMNLDVGMKALLISHTIIEWIEILLVMKTFKSHSKISLLLLQVWSALS